MFFLNFRLINNRFGKLNLEMSAAWKNFSRILYGKNLIGLGSMVLGFEWVICYSLEDEFRGHILSISLYLVCFVTNLVPGLVYFVKCLGFRVWMFTGLSFERVVEIRYHAENLAQVEMGAVKLKDEESEVFGSQGKDNSSLIF